MSELFPNAYGFKLWAILIAVFIMAACIGAFLHSLWLLWKNYQPKKQVYHLDEFEGLDDPFVSRFNVVDAVRVFRFESATELAMWVNGNIPNEFRQEQLMKYALDYKKVNGEYLIAVELSQEELDWIDHKS